MKDPSYNPFNDEKLHITVNKNESSSNKERAPFNDIIKHGDLVQGFQSPKQIEQFPKWYQNPRKIYAIISLLGFASLLVYQIIRIVTAIVTGE